MANAIQTLNKVFTYTDTYRSARWTFAELSSAVNDAILQFCQETMGNAKDLDPSGFQWDSLIRDDLYPLITVATPTVTQGTVVTTDYGSFLPSTIPTPTDYMTYVSSYMVLDGIRTFVRPTSYNEIGPLLVDSFKMPTNKKIYANESASTITFWRGPTGTPTLTLTYLKFPTTFSCGSETQLIAAAGTLVNLSIYIAVEISVYNAVTYQIGSLITGSGAALTSGSVILQSNTTPILLPEKTQMKICRLAADNLLGNIKDFEASAFSEKEAQKS